MTGTEPIRVLIVDNHPIVRQGLRSFLGVPIVFKGDVIGAF